MGSVERLGGLGLKGGTGDTFGVVPLTTYVPVGDQSVTLGTTKGGHVHNTVKITGLANTYPRARTYKR